MIRELPKKNASMIRDIRHLTNVQFARIQKIETVNWLWIDGLTKNMPQNCRISLITDIKKIKNKKVAKFILDEY